MALTYQDLDLTREDIWLWKQSYHKLEDPPPAREYIQDKLQQRELDVELDTSARTDVTAATTPLIDLIMDDWDSYA